jgi:quaternary ammonium compound-resistance protein SugE
MAWAILFVAGLMEIGWAIGLKYTEGFSRPLPSVLTLACMAASVILLGLAVKTLPIGTAYAVWTGTARSEPPFWASSCSAIPPPPFALPASD